MKYFWKTHEIVKSAWIFSQNHVSRTITSHVIRISWFQHGYKVEIFLKNSWNCEIRHNFFIKTCFTNNYLSRDPHFVILAWVQSWNGFDKLMKVCSPSEFLHKTCLTNKYFSRNPHFVILAWVQCWNILKIHESVKPARIHSQNMSHENCLSCDPHFVILAWVQSWNLLTNLRKCVVRQNFLKIHVSRTITFHVIHISRF